MNIQPYELGFPPKPAMWEKSSDTKTHPTTLFALGCLNKS